MNLLQNSVIILTGFLLSEMLVAARVHHRLIELLLRHTGKNLSALLTAILLISYTLSIFISHTIVVISMIPVINHLLSLVELRDEKRIAASLLYLALTFGSNCGGMASLTGSPQNLLAIALAELFKFEDRHLITFFSWLAAGVPATLILLFFGWAIILFSAKPFSIPSIFSQSSDTPTILPNKPLLFLISNLLLISTLTAMQFFFKPAPILFGMNSIDLCFLLYGIIFLFVAFIIPKKRLSLEAFLMNTLFLLLNLTGFPLIFISRLCREVESRMRIPLNRFYRAIERFLQRLFDHIWYHFFREPITNLDKPNPDSFLSINLIMKDLPCFGIFLLVVVGMILFALLKAWDNPATPEVDGYLLTLAKSTILNEMKPFGNHFLQLLSLIIVIIFSSELLSNTALILMFTPLANAFALQTSLSPIIMLLTITIAASSAFMTPVATAANTLAFGGIEHVSLKMILIPGFFMNLIAALLTALLFSLLSLLMS
jgi:solute carrier family 13 (sodium-dependent dicarboxylate transporter), member 2/3/5